MGHFLPTWIWIRIQPTKSNADPIGSGTHLEAFKNLTLFCARNYRNVWNCFEKSVMSKSVCLYSSFHAECVTGDLAAELREVGVALQLLCIAPDVVETPVGPEVRGGGEEARQIQNAPPLPCPVTAGCRYAAEIAGIFAHFPNSKSHCQTKFAFLIRHWYQRRPRYVFGIKMNCNAPRILEISFWMTKVIEKLRERDFSSMLWLCISIKRVLWFH